MALQVHGHPFARSPRHTPRDLSDPIGPRIGLPSQESDGCNDDGGCKACCPDRGPSKRRIVKAEECNGQKGEDRSREGCAGGQRYERDSKKR